VFSLIQNRGWRLNSSPVPVFVKLYNGISWSSFVIWPRLAHALFHSSTFSFHFPLHPCNPSTVIPHNIQVYLGYVVVSIYILSFLDLFPSKLV